MHTRPVSNLPFPWCIDIISLDTSFCYLSPHFWDTSHAPIGLCCQHPYQASLIDVLAIQSSTLININDRLSPLTFISFLRGNGAFLQWHNTALTWFDLCQIWSLPYLLRPILCHIKQTPALNQRFNKHIVLQGPRQPPFHTEQCHWNANLIWAELKGQG